MSSKAKATQHNDGRGEARGLRARPVLRTSLKLMTLGLAALALLGGPEQGEAAEAQTKVILNGETVPVYFNDGDSFRVLGGSYKDAKARLFGYNTLESYGAVHQWGDWTARELFVLAKMGTYNGRDGVWECETDGKTDTYGRILVWCPKLAEDQIRKGYAHVMSIDDNPGIPELVEAQKDAIAARRGIWAHGVPEFVLTSLHSKEEDVDGKGTYNRLVSSLDGHSVKWRHSTRYRECDKVCHYEYEVDAATVDEVLSAARSDAEISPYLAKLDDAAARSVILEFARFRHINREIPEDDRDALDALLTTWADAGRFGTQVEHESACMIHVPFQRRFGGGKAECLK
ncbi:thermonuclease family protein [Pseudenhygromyxa sp. WMMC2535]|uniref:thermonuclease family protein n=1 Tax=Pseudenhygromyxa sp. WMMC2535 TaxID=2712867 RepID=UPI001556C9B2|nr:thermonuclease family protein [Pseudenhygromyxa sp. WMMC2535]NVB38707.1 thermonuclease family protein [Pseudenhygromyxa sp. WMMC2535]